MSPQTIGHYILNKKIGRGSFAVVYKAKHKATKKTVAIKCIALNKVPNCHRHYIDMEIKVMRDIRHPHLLSCNEFIRTDTQVFLIVEYCSLGDLHDFHKESYYSQGMPEDVVLHFLPQLASAVKYLHGRNLIHRDIKPRNILLIPSTCDNKTMALPSIKLADFGFTRFLPKTSLADSVCGSPLYMAPEVLNRIAYDAKADIWSLGVVLFELMTGQVLFPVSNHIELSYEMRLYNDDVDFGDAESHFSSTLKDLIKVLLKKNPALRASSETFSYYVDLVTTKDKTQLSLIGSAEIREAKESEDEDEFVVIDNDETVIEKTTVSKPLMIRRRHSSPNEQQQKQKQQVTRTRTLSNGASRIAKAISSIAPLNFFSGSNDGKPSSLLSSTSTIVDKTANFEPREMSYQCSQLLIDLKQSNDLLKSVMTFANEKYRQFEKDPHNHAAAEESRCLTLKISNILRLSIQKLNRQYEDLLMSKDQDLDFKLEDIESFVWIKHMLKLYTERLSQFSTIAKTTSCSVESILYDKAMDMRKEAAVLQLVGEDLEKSIFKYTCSIHLLRAIVTEPTDNMLLPKDKDIIERTIKSIYGKIQQVETVMNTKKLKQ